MKRFIYLFGFLLMLTNTSAQDKEFTLEDLLPGGKSYDQFVPKMEMDYRWAGDNLIGISESKLYTQTKAGFQLDETLNTLLENEKLNVRQLRFISVQNETRGMITVPGKRIVFIDPDQKKIDFEIPLEKDWQNIDFCPTNQSIAFTKENNLYIRNAVSEPFVVAEDKNESIVYGQAVHRNEFGINKGTFWSPEGNYLAFYRMDETMVSDYPLVDISAREAELKSIKYPMAGMASHEVVLGIYNLNTGEIVYLNTGEPKDHYLTNISWDPDNRHIYIAELNRDQNHLQLNQYDILTGEKTATLFEERNEKYVEPQHPLLFLRNQPNLFIWQSRRDGYDHLYLYNTKGELLKQLTSGAFEVDRVLGLDKKEQHLFYSANENNPIEYQVFKVNLKSGKKQQLTLEAGVHSASLNESGTQLLDRYSNLNTPLNINLISCEKGKATSLGNAKNPYSDYIVPEVTLGAIKADDGKTDLYYRLLKPINFDPEKKYPVVVYVYGGPHSQGVKNNWMGSTRGWEIYMAQKGYVIFTLDNRGTSNRGTEFEQAIFRRLGIVETADQIRGVEFLKSLPYVDTDRIGVHGWSYGGFMTTNLMLRHPDIFKVGVAGGPVIDWKYYEVMYGERYMDSPQDNPEGYEETNMNNLAGNLKGRFLIIHGDEDPTVVMQNSLSFLKACISAKTYPDFFVYPGHGHNMMGSDRIHLHEKITRYFEDYLK